MAADAASIDRTPDEYASFGLVPQVTRHAYHERDLFSIERLVALLDAHPRRRLQAFTMGEDPTRRDDRHAVDIAPGTSGTDLRRAAERGRLWLNVTQIERFHPEYAELIGGMYAHLDAHCPRLGGPRPNYSTLLISSPGARVYYHLDAEPNMLWHLRGNKRLWVYPAMDTRFAPQRYLEDIYAGEVDENLPYDPAFDAEAEAFLLEPGDVASWPHNGPHRIVNVDMHVSLATSYDTPRIYRRQYVRLANRFVLRPLGLRSRSMAERGVLPSLKRATFRIVDRVRPFSRRDRSADYVTDLRIDPDAPLGLRRLDALADDWQRFAAAPETTRSGGGAEGGVKAIVDGDADRDADGGATGVFDGWSWNRLWWEHHGYLGTLAFFQTGFDPAYAKLGPGYLLMHWMIERGIEDGLVRIDLLKGDYGYKSGYASARRECRSIDLCTRPLLARLVGAARSVRDAVSRARR